MALEQLDLEMVERLDIGQAQPDRLVERQFFSSSRVCRVTESRPSRVRPQPIADAAEDRLARAHVLDQGDIMAGDRHVGFGQHHLQLIGVARRKGQPSTISRSSA